MHELRDADGRFVARLRSSVTAHRSTRRARHLGASVNHARGNLSFRITETVYHRQPGFLVSGRGTGTFPTKIFTTKRENAEAIRDALRRDDHDEVSRILLAEARESDANRILPRGARKFAPSENFSAIVRTGSKESDTVIVAYQGPSLSTARVKAKIAADQWQKPVDVIDDGWKKIATYRPGDSL